MTSGKISELPRSLQLSDWRRRVASLYVLVRRTETPQAAWHIWREGRDRLFRDHPQSPLTASETATFRGLPLFPYDPGWRLSVDAAPLDEGAGFDVDLGADGVLHLVPCAKTVGLSRALGRELTLFRLDGYGGGLFLPFRDGTAATSTYGGGRYLLDTIKGADLGLENGRLVLDFNFAYNPSCCYSPRWTCPLAPPENTVDTPIRAGERLR